MIRTYSILSTNGELQTSPYVNKMQRHFDILLSVNKPQIVNFLFQFPVDYSDGARLRAVYDRDVLKVGELMVDRFKHQTLVSAKLTAKEVGSMEISFTIPYRSRTSKNSLGAVTIEC